MGAYVIAGLIGFVLGLVAIYVTTVTPFWDDWRIPFYDGEFFSIAPKVTPAATGADELWEKALVLRFFHLLVDGGFPYIAIPVGFGLGMVKLSRLAAKSRCARIILILLIGCLCLVAAAGAYMCSGFDSNIAS